MEDPAEQRPSRVIAVLGRKGGVGKTSVVQLLARHMAAQGLQVGVLDTDLCCPTVHDALLPPRAAAVADGDAKAEAEAEARDIRYGRNQGWTPVTVPVGEAGGNLKVFSLALLLPADEPASYVWLPHRKRMLVQQFLSHVVWGKLDLLLVDTPPSVGEVHTALLEHLGGLPNSGALLVASEGSAASAVATRCDVIFCKAQRVRTVGIVVAAVGSGQRGAAGAGGGEGAAAEGEEGAKESGGAAPCDGALDDVAAETGVPVVARLRLGGGGGVADGALEGLVQLLRSEAPTEQ